MPVRTILSTDAPKPFTIERVNDTVLLELHLHKMRLGKGAATWLLAALRNTLTRSGGIKQTLEHEGKAALTVFNESGHIYIIGAKARFTMKSDVANKIVDWLEL